MRRASPVGFRREPLSLDEVLGRWPSIRQSAASRFDDCELQALFEMRYAQGYSTHPQAAGQIFHRVAAECLRTMREQDMERISVGIALAILEEALYQRGVPSSERVRVPAREVGLLEMAVRKWSADNAFTVRNIIDVERRLEWDLEGVEHWETGEKYTRRLTGQLDALIARPPDEAVVLDWKKTWQLPPEREEDAEDPGLSYEGYFQQLFYSVGVMRCYPAVQAVVTREFYVLRTKPRSARLTRQDLPKAEQRLRYLVANYDRALAVGEPRRLHLADLEEHGSWIPSPGKHCGNCAASRLCPIEDMYRDDGGIRTPEQAEKLAAVRTQAKSIHKFADRALQVWANVHGPIPIKSSKGRRVLGYRRLTTGKTRWDEFTPEGVDRPPDQVAHDPNLGEAAMDRGRLEEDPAAAEKAYLETLYRDLDAAVGAQDHHEEARLQREVEIVKGRITRLEAGSE